jgi:hypothetical protein
MSNLLAVGRLDNRFLQRLVPGKSLIAIAKRWCCYGGGVFFPPNVVCKRVTTIEEDEPSSKRLKVGKSILGVTTNFDMKPKESLNTNSKGTNNFDMKTRTEVTNPVAVNVETVEEDCNDTYHKMLNDITRENHERKAVKLDDAAVPVYLWEEHLLEGLASQRLTNSDILKVRRVSE